MDLTEEQKTFVKQNHRELKDLHETWAESVLERATNMDSCERRDFLIDLHREIKDEVLPALDEKPGDDESDIEEFPFT